VWKFRSVFHQLSYPVEHPWILGHPLFPKKIYLAGRLYDFRGLAVVAEGANIREMSRRSRKRPGSGERRWLGKAVVAMLVLGLISVVAFYTILRNYLHSDAFRKFLSVEASEMAHVNGQFDLFRWEGLALETDSFEATGDGPVTGVRADGLHTEVGLGGVRRGVWEIRESSVRRLEVSVDTTKLPNEKTTNHSSGHSSKKSPRPAWFPSDAELQGVDVREVAVKAILRQGLAVASGLHVHAEQTGAKGAYRSEIEGGTIRMPFAMAPELRLERARLRYQEGQVFLTDSTVAAWENGRIHLSGEWNMKSRQFSATGDVSGMKCEDVLPPDWSKRLAGDVVLDFTSDNRLSYPQARGKLTIQNATLTALPMLDALAAYADTRRFRVLALDDARTEWRLKNGEISLSNLVLASEGLVRLEGSMVIREQKIDGLFRLGLAPGTLSTIPGAETDVFLPGERGLLWTPVHITGTLDDPQEDLTERLVAAAGLRMFDQIPETGEKVIKFTRSVLGDSSEKTIQRGVKLLENSSGTVREVSSILGSLLEGRAPKEPEENHDAR
jgi:hypothetical protein